MSPGSLRQPHSSGVSGVGLSADVRDALGMLATRGAPELDARRVLLVVAHPDDETIGLGAQLPRMRGITLVHVTDGSPADLRDARMLGFTGREDYAAARRDELETAMALAGIPPTRLVGLGVADQEAAQVMAGVAQRLADLMARRNIALVLTHAYEGGHPDHDATAFAVHAACALLRRQGGGAPAVLEMAGYHAGPAGDLVAGTFLVGDAGPGLGLRLDEETLILKRRLLACFRSQQPVLVQFRPDTPERLRPAPAYDFFRPPHPGTLWYENFAWGLDGPRWRELAAKAAVELRLGTPHWP